MSSEDAAPPPSFDDLPMQEEVALHAYELNREMQGLTPLRLHASRVPEKLSSPASSPVAPRHHVRVRSLDRLGTTRTRSRSPLSNWDSSSFSSLEDIVDQDILLDKRGFVELDCKEQQALSQGLHQSHAAACHGTHE